jgi:hypothetical protein
MKQFLMSVDQTLNTCIHIAGDDNDGWGMADELLSARAWRCFIQGHISDCLYRTIDAVFFWQPNHCYQSWQGEFKRAQMPKAYSL